MRNSGMIPYLFRTFLKNHLIEVKTYQIYVISVHKFSIGGKEKERERREKNQECGITTITIFPINPNLRYVATL